MKNYSESDNILPKIWYVGSNRTGVEKPIELQIVKIRKNVSRRVSPLPQLYKHRYYVDVKPYTIEIYDGETQTQDDGFSSGFGDLWHWTDFSTFDKDVADMFYEKEYTRVMDKYILN